MATAKTATKGKEDVKNEELANAGVPGTALAEVKGGAIAAAAFMDDADFNAGMEGADAESFAIPFLHILQKMSPIVDEDSPKHVPGMKAGMVFNTVSQKAYDVRETPLQIIPCSFKRSFILWGPRDEGGGFKGELTVDQMEAIIAETPPKVELADGRYYVLDKDGKFNAKKSDYYADTRSHYVIVRDPENGEDSPAILSLASTQIKASKQLLTLLQQKKVLHAGVRKTPPTFANVVEFTTVSQQNEKGTWAGAKFELSGMVTEPDLYAMAKDFYRAVSSGEVQADYSKAAGDADAGSSAGVSDKPADADNF